MWELVLGAHLLKQSGGRATFDGWRAQARDRMRRLPYPQRRLWGYLTPAHGPFPDFLTPAQPSPSLEAGIEAVRRTPARRIAHDLSLLRAAPGWVRSLADGEAHAVRELGDTLRRAYEATLAPHWPRVEALIDADRRLRARTSLEQGVEGLLSGLGPAFRWRPPVLEAEYPVPRELHLGGRGLLLVPSVFCRRTPVTFVDDDLQPVLVYPVVKEPGWWTEPADAAHPGRSSLGQLLGGTRAAALRAVEDGCSTSELARRTGVSAPTASQHAAALREARLLRSTRRGNEMVHTLTPLGRALLEANAPS